MDSFEINKIIAAVVVIFVVIFGITKISDIIYYVEKPSQSAYKVEFAETDSTKASAAVEAVDISALLAMGSVDHGKKFLRNVVHVIRLKKVEETILAQHFIMYLGRNMGALEDYKYSKALIAFGKDWTFQEMNSFLIKPASYIKGTKMAFAGLKKEKDRASVILYMNANADSPLQLP